MSDDQMEIGSADSAVVVSTKKKSGRWLTRQEAMSDLSLDHPPGHTWSEEDQEFRPMGEMMVRENLAKPIDLVANAERFVEARKALLKFVAEQMVEAEYDDKGLPVPGKMGDFYVVPGSKHKALTKKGGENLAAFFRYFAGPMKLESQTKTKEYVDATVSMTILDHYGRTVGSAVSSCSSAEGSYQAYGAKFKYGGKKDRGSDDWKVEPDYRAALNDITAKARKRCFVQAVILATATDEIFEQAPVAFETEVDKAEETAKRPKKMPVGKYKDKPISDVPSDSLKGCIKWCGEKPKLQELKDVCEIELDERRINEDEVDF